MFENILDYCNLELHKVKEDTYNIHFEMNENKLHRNIDELKKTLINLGNMINYDLSITVINDKVSIFIRDRDEDI